MLGPANKEAKTDEMSPSFLTLAWLAMVRALEPRALAGPDDKDLNKQLVHAGRVPKSEVDAYSGHVKS